MIIEYLGHSCFLISGEKLSVVTDPFSGLGYDMRRVKADYCLSSHEHFDHDAFENVDCKKIVKGLEKDVCPEIRFDKKIVDHDDCGGKKRGKTAVMKFVVDGVKFIHFGDIGCDFEDDEFYDADVCFVPVGGFYTIDALQAEKYARATKAKIIVPMHFLTPRSFDVLKNEKDFTDKFDCVKRVDFAELTKSSLPENATVYVFDYAKF